MIVRRRTWQIVSASLAAALAISVCATPISARNARDSHTPVNLTWSMWSASPPEVAAWQWDAAHVTKVYPWIHVKFETSTFNDYWPKLQSEAATGGLPDIISLQGQHAPGYHDAYMPLNAMVKSNNFDIQNFNPGIVKELSYEGNLYALPYDFGPIVVYYNKNLFDAAKVSYPAFNWTYDQFEKDAIKISNPAKQIYGFNANPTIDFWLPFVLSAGAQYISKDWKTLELTNPQVAPIVQRILSLDYKYGASPAQSVPLEQYAFAQFQSGNIAMYTDGPWDMINLKTSVKFNMGIATIPSINGHSISQTAGSGFGISKTAKDPHRRVAGDFRAYGPHGGAVPCHGWARLSGPRGGSEILVRKCRARGAKGARISAEPCSAICHHAELATSGNPHPDVPHANCEQRG